MLKYMPDWCFTSTVDIPSQQQLPLYNTHFVSLPQMLLKRGNTVYETEIATSDLEISEKSNNMR